MKHPQSVGLALGSGAFRGFAHIGVIKVLEKKGVAIDYIAGSSIGAWIAAYYAVFQDIRRLENDLLADPKGGLAAFIDPSLIGGFIGGRKLNSYLEKSLGRHSFSSLKIPLRIVATDLISGLPFIFKEGDVAKAVRASTSVPLVFRPESYQNKLLVDGALSNPVPVGALKEMGAKSVIAVNLYHRNEFVNRKFTMSKIALRSMRIVIHNLAKVDIKEAAAVIEPDCSPFIKKEGWGKYFTTEVIAALITIGEEAAERAWPAIERALAEGK
ncbi:TPA: hypothetical protein DCZ15_01535 [Candidatus Falkowbacteria bacterium]|jgi:NTE family protein|nr:MAG: Patatin [Candidatus Falkowbacteria bacterium GW2011_GWF2_43_32]HBA36538.1 hypothetical protein [Candidatus Falkowbacteria bacterium]